MYKYLIVFFLLSIQMIAKKSESQGITIEKLNSLMKSSDSMFFLDFPQRINRTLKSEKKSIVKDLMGREFCVTSFKDKLNNIKKRKVIHRAGKNQFNYQVFYIKIEKITLGVCYDALDKSVDESTDNIPFVLGYLNSVLVSVDSNASYIVLHDNIDELSTCPQIRNSFRIVMLDKRFIPQKMIFVDNQEIYQFDIPKRELLFLRLEDIKATEISMLFNLSDNGKKVASINEAKISKLKKLSFFNWFLHTIRD